MATETGLYPILDGDNKTTRVAVEMSGAERGAQKRVEIVQGARVLLASPRSAATPRTQRTLDPLQLMTWEFESHKKQTFAGKYDGGRGMAEPGRNHIHALSTPDADSTVRYTLNERHPPTTS